MNKESIYELKEFLKALGGSFLLVILLEPHLDEQFVLIHTFFLAFVIRFAYNLGIKKGRGY